MAAGTTLLKAFQLATVVAESSIVSLGRR